MSILDLMEKKKEMIREVPPNKRIKDEHSKRAPIKCGLTVHPGYGCSLGCLYCYIYDMGLGDPVPSKLDGQSFLYSLLSNPYFLPEKTFLAIGSITEPLLPEVIEKTLEFSEEIKKLGNPVQLSTKLPDRGGEEFLEIIPEASFLVSISDSKGLLEPKAPPPRERISLASSLRERGYNVYLFLRPIIPGYTEKDERLIEMIGKANVKGVVLGGLRVTERILRVLERKGLSEEIFRRIRRRPLGREQLAVYVRDVKEGIKRELEEVGIRTFPLACAATADSYSLGCSLCSHRCEGKRERVNEKEIMEFLKALGEEVEVKFKRDKILVFGKIRRFEKELLKAYYRLPVLEVRAD